MAVIDVIICVLKVVTTVYDVISLPIYRIITPRWETRTKQKLGRVVQVESSEKEISFLREKGHSQIFQEIIVDKKVDTVTKAFDYAVKKYGDQSCLGVREVLGEEDEVQKSGKVFKKNTLGKYVWMSYNEVQSLAREFGRGLRRLGLEPGDRIAIYAETRSEWMFACLGAFSQNIHVATVYANLGDEGVVHAINETQVNIVVTSHELLPRFKEMLPNLDQVTHVIFMEDQLRKTCTQGFKESVEIVSVQAVLKSGEDSNGSIPENPPTADDPAIIMYTSGSTGVPKGVVLTHRNLVATMQCLMFMLDPKDELYIAYLPLAHVLELLSELTMMLFGVRVGYSSPNTMTDMSTKVKQGQKGDAGILKPTYMCAVPIIMDRIYKNIMDSVQKRGPGFERIFNFVYEYKKFWVGKGYTTPILDRLVFNKMKNLLGGRIHTILVGGAPLAEQTHDFIRVCLGCIVIQGYSLTETCCTGTVMEFRDLSTGRVGKPMTGLEVKLTDWTEGGYTIRDNPPRGEIMISGAPVASGYFKQDSDEAKDFFVDMNGKRWFKTGDIGEFDAHGSLKIIDRKKDLVKLQQGEYVSLGKVEAQLKTHPLVDNICVYGDPHQKYIVAIVVTNQAQLERLGHDMGKTVGFAEMCVDRQVVDRVTKILSEHGKSRGLKTFEIPHRLSLVTDQWTPESGLITAAFKIKRKQVHNHYRKDIHRMYAGSA